MVKSMKGKKPKLIAKKRYWADTPFKRWLAGTFIFGLFVFGFFVLASSDNPIVFFLEVGLVFLGIKLKLGGFI